MTRRTKHPALGTPLCRAAVLFLLVLGNTLACSPPPDQGRLPESTDSFAELVERFSEPGGYFDTDNLISNERSYLHVVDQLEEQRIRGGAYIGVGPDQNFSYIAAIRPDVAFIVDIRRDNLLQHLKFKALFELARSRLEYLALLHARPVPTQPEDWNTTPIDALVAYIDSVHVDPLEVEKVFRLIDSTVVTFGVPLSQEDRETIRQFHTTFAREGLSLKFRTHGRRPLPHYPTLRELVLETDRAGHQASFLADEEAFRFVKALQEADRVIPVVGDLAGGHAMRAIAGFLAERDLTVSAFYTSNVEYYLMGSGKFAAFADNVARLPKSDRSMFIRSVFNRGLWFTHPQSVPGYASAQLLQSMQEFSNTMSGFGYRSYQDLVVDESVAVPR